MLSGFTPSCVIFDMDGTLTQTNHLIFASFNHVAAKYLGKTLNSQEIIALFGPPEEGGLEKLVGPAFAPTAMEELCDFYRSHHDEMASVHQGILPTLELLKKSGIPMAVFTGKGRRTATMTLDALDLAGYFDLVISGSDVRKHKPDPEGIYAVMQQLPAHPESVLMVGDSLSDIAASRAAGVAVAAVLWDSYDKERVLTAGADVVFHRTEEMFVWFKERLETQEKINR